MPIKVFTIRVVVDVQPGDPSNVAEREATNALSTLQDVEADNIDPNVCFGLGEEVKPTAADEQNMEDYKRQCEQILAEIDGDDLDDDED